MKRSPTRSVSVLLTSYTIAADRLATLACRGCRSDLDLHQPDPTRPHDFLGTCPTCGRWCRVELEDEAGRITVVELPAVADTPPSAPSDQAPD